MPKIIVFLSFIVFMGCQQNQKLSLGTSPIDSVDAPRFKFKETTKDFGKINSGDVVSHHFMFTNVGKSPLIISEVQAQCGCTIPKWPSEAIQPGEQGDILVQFNSARKTGTQKKQVTIISNTFAQQEYLSFTAEVAEIKQ